MCTDPIPLLSFIPPFVEPEFGDCWKVNPWAVRILWVFLIMFCFAVPYYIVKKGGFNEKKQ